MTVAIHQEKFKRWIGRFAITAFQIERDVENKTRSPHSESCGLHWAGSWSSAPGKRLHLSQKSTTKFWPAPGSLQRERGGGCPVTKTGTAPPHSDPIQPQGSHWVVQGQQSSRNSSQKANVPLLTHSRERRGGWRGTSTAPVLFGLSMWQVLEPTDPVAQRAAAVDLIPVTCRQIEEAVTDSWAHRITQVGRDLRMSSSPTSCSKQGHGEVSKMFLPLKSQPPIAVAGSALPETS